MKTAYWCLILVLVIAGFGYAAVIRVPADYPTIQAGIDAAVNGDTVLVADGTYKGIGNKDLDFKGKAITVTSENGAENCIIDCEHDGRGFNFHSGETKQSVVNGFTITNGWRNDYSGGIHCYHNSSPTITNNIITGNSAGNRGGGIYCDYSSPIIANNFITGNSAVWQAGGIYCDYSSPIIVNNLIAGNSAGTSSLGGGGAIFCYGFHSSPIITNNTITANLADSGAAIAGEYYSSPTLTNNILWNDSLQEIYLLGGSSITVTYSDIQGGWAGEGNIDLDPLFINPINDYHLSGLSPCIGAGIMTTGVPTIDIEGNLRPNPLGSSPDIGAYESPLGEPIPEPSTIVLISCGLLGLLGICVKRRRKEK